MVAQQVPRAIPLTDPNGNPPPRAIPVEPSRPVAPAPKAADPGDDLYDFAMIAYSQKDYVAATKPFQDYVKSYPAGHRAAEAWFLLGQCYLKTEQFSEANRAYSQVITHFPHSEVAGGAAFRMAEMAFTNKDFTAAAQLFDTSERLAVTSEIKVVAMYNKALSYRGGGNKAKALATYKTLAALPPPNAYRDVALQEVATSELDAGKLGAAREAFQQIISTSKDDALRGNAMVYVGDIERQEGNPDAAIKAYTQALDNKSLSADIRGRAVMGLVEAAYAKGDYTTVVDTYTRNSTVLPPADLRPKLLLLVGMAHKQLKQYRQAVSLFLMLEKNYPDSPEAFQGAYQNLLCFSQLSDKDLPQFTTHFEEKYGENHANHEYIIMSHLIRADWYFSKGDYKNAAEAYSTIDLKKVPQNIRASAAYQKGFAEAESKKYPEAIASLTFFITEYPKDANIPIAIAQRGLCHTANRAFDRALADFDRIIKEFPNSPAVEMAYEQEGLIKAETRDSVGMITAFEALLKKFPNGAAAAKANFYIGRGYVDLHTEDAIRKAIAPLRRAIELDPKYRDKAYPYLLVCYSSLKDLDNLTKAVDAWLAANPQAQIDPLVLKYLALVYFQRGNYKASIPYFRMQTTPGSPETTPASVWNLLGIALVETGQYKEGLEALENYLTQAKAQSLGTDSRALFYKGRALLALKDLPAANKVVTEALQGERQGKLHGQLSLLEGDINQAMGDELEAKGDHAGAVEKWKLAAGNYVVVSQTFVDPELTPAALEKLIEILEKMGDHLKADSFRSQLQSKYPDYKSKDSKTKEKSK